jgi:MFS transporter, DHA1 family, inner membrane transport protein
VSEKKMSFLSWGNYSTESMKFTNVFTRAEKLLLFSLAFIQFNHIVDFMIIMPLGPQLMRLFSITPQQFSKLVAAYTLSASITGIIISVFIDRFDRKKSLLFFFVGFGISTIFCALANSYETLLYARLMAGAFGGVIGSLILAIAGDAIPAERRATAMGTIATGFSLASIVGVPFSLVLANLYDWHAPFMFLGILSLAMTALIIIAIPSMTKHIRHHREQPFYAPIKAIFLEKQQYLTAAFTVCLIFGSFTIIPFLSPSYVANGGMQEADLPYLYLLGGLCSIVSAPLFGRLADEKGKQKIFRVLAAVNIIPILFITELRPSPLFVLLLLSSFFFITMSGRMAPAQAMITGAVRAEQRGGFMSLIASLQNLAIAAASFVAGAIVDRAPDGRLLHYQYVGYIAVVFTLFSIYISRQIKAPEGHA